MKKETFWGICALSALLFGALIPAAAYVNARSLETAANVPKIETVVIDAGHGGFDGGTVAADGTLEKEINLSIANRLCALLHCAGVQTVMTRTGDDSIHDPSCTSVRQQKISDIRNRLQIMTQTENSIFVSIHQNHFTQSRYHGTQVFYSGNDARSRILAQCIQSSVVSSLQPENSRQIKQSGTEIYLLYHAVRPAVMVECGFLSNPPETERLKEPQYQTQMAVAVMQGILNFMQSTEEV